MTDHHRFEYIGASVTRLLCKPGGLEAPTIVTLDSKTGAAVEFTQLADADRAAFHGWHASVDPAFREMLEQKPAEPVEAYLWFYVDESDAPNKEWLVAEPSAATVAVSLREVRMRSAAAALAKKLQASPDVEIATDVIAPEEYGIPIIRVRAKLADFEQIGAWPEVWRIDPVPTRFTPQSDTYYYTTLDSYLDGLFGHDGTGQTVALFEQTRPDSWANLTGAVAGSCADDFGAQKKCHCAAGAKHSHPRYVAGIIRRSSGILGMANEASTIAANHFGGCQTNGPDSISSALNWATTNGARVILTTDSTGPGTALDFLFDYKASVSPYPIVVGVAGNNSAADVASHHRNGLVTGGALESPPGSSNRASVTTDPAKSWRNPTGTAGFEVPHIAAISEDVTGYCHDLWTVTVSGGTSAAAPQVAGVAASLHEANSALVSWPEVMVPGLMVSANQDLDNTPLNLHDGWDDRDGAGLLNAYHALLVLQSSSRVHGGSPARRAAHDYHVLTSSGTPEGTFYIEEYAARVPAGVELRAEAFLQTRPTCPQNPGSGSCTADPYPFFGLFVYDNATLVRAALNASSNYQYISHFNTTGVQKDYTVRIYMGGWNGLTQTTFGLAWDSY
ncbi:MAG: S8 family serine peptidase [Myxococcales bacterium]|nr:S8 family serine peptidase [Myxococcales bacterium]